MVQPAPLSTSRGGPAVGPRASEPLLCWASLSRSPTVSRRAFGRHRRPASRPRPLPSSAPTRSRPLPLVAVQARPCPPTGKARPTPGPAARCRSSLARPRVNIIQIIDGAALTRHTNLSRLSRCPVSPDAWAPPEPGRPQVRAGRAKWPTVELVAVPAVLRAATSQSPRLWCGPLCASLSCIERDRRAGLASSMTSDCAVGPLSGCINGQVAGRVLPQWTRGRAADCIHAARCRGLRARRGLAAITAAVRGCRRTRPGWSLVAVAANATLCVEQRYRTHVRTVRRDYGAADPACHGGGPVGRSQKGFSGSGGGGGLTET